MSSRTLPSRRTIRWSSWDQRVPQAVERLAGARFGVGHALAKARHDLFDKGCGVLAGLRERQAGFERGQGFAAVLRVVRDLARDAGDGLLDRLQRLGGARAGKLVLHAPQALGGRRLFGAEPLGGGVEAAGDGELFALGCLQARHGVAHRMLDARDGQPRPHLRGLDAVGEQIQRERDPSKVIGPELVAEVCMKDFEVSVTARSGLAPKCASEVTSSGTSSSRITRFSHSPSVIPERRQAPSRPRGPSDRCL